MTSCRNGCRPWRLSARSQASGLSSRCAEHDRGRTSRDAKSGWRSSGARVDDGPLRDTKLAALSTARPRRRSRYAHVCSHPSPPVLGAWPEGRPGLGLSDRADEGAGFGCGAAGLMAFPNRSPPGQVRAIRPRTTKTQSRCCHCLQQTHPRLSRVKGTRVRLYILRRSTNLP